MSKFRVANRKGIVKHQFKGLKAPTDTEIEKGLAEMVTLGLMEIVPGKDGQPGFKLTKKGEERAEKLMADALKKKGGR